MRLYTILFFALLLLILLISNQSITLWDQDEAAYAGFGKYFLENPHAHIPQFMWSEPHRKTPLHFWLIAYSYKIFGINEFAVRFPSSLAVFFTYLICFFRVKKYFSLRIAFLTTVILGTSFFVPLMAKIALTDALLFLWSSICGWAVIAMMMQDETSTWFSKRNLIPFFSFWIAFALAVLTKGPPIIIFTGIFATLLFFLHPKRFQLFRFHPWIFLPIALLPIAYWAYLTTKEDGGAFLRWFIDWYILKRVNSYVFGQTGPPGYYLMTFFGFFLPFLPFLFPAIYHIFRYMGNAVLIYLPRNIQSYFPNRLPTIGLEFLLSAWFISAWLLYEILPSKLPSYVLCAYVPLAVMMAIAADKLWTNFSKKGGFITYLHSFLMTSLGVGLMLIPHFIEVSQIILICLETIGGLVLLGALVAIFFYQKNTPNYYIYTLCANAAIFLLLVWGFLIPKLDSMRNGTKQVATNLAATLSSDTPIFIANHEGKPPSLPFYLSLHFKQISEINDFQQVYNTQKNGGFILNEAQFTTLKEANPNIEGKFFSTYRTDRGGKSDYWVVVKY